MTSIFGTVLGTWQDVVQATRRTPALLASAFALVMVANLVMTWVIPYGSRTLPLPLFGAYAAVTLVHSLILVPVAIAIHRLVILNEVASRYALDLTSTRVLRYFGLTVLFIFTPWVNQLLTALFAGQDVKTIFEYQKLLTIALSLLCILAFPAIAIDAPRATGRKTTRAIRGYFWRIVIVFVVACLPVGMLRVGIHWLLGDQMGLRLLAAPLAAVLDVLQTVIFASVGARHYRWLAHRIHGGVDGNSGDSGSAYVDEAAR